MQVLIAPDSMGGRLAARGVADTVAEGWKLERPDDHLALVPMSDGGEGLLETLQAPDDRVETVEVAGPLGHPVDASLLLRPDGTAILESASACGLHLVDPARRDPLRATTFGVGELLDAARMLGARRVVVGLGGSASVDGGAGALTGLGLRLRVADGSGLKIGAADLHRIDRIERGWLSPGWSEVEVEALTDVRTPLGDAASVFGPQKGATSEGIDQLDQALSAWVTVVARDLDADGLAALPGTGAAGGLGYGLAAAIGADLVPGAARVADLVGLDDAMARADLVVTGEGRVDMTSWAGKVVGEVVERARGRDLPVALVAGRSEDGALPEEVAGLELAPGDTPEQARRALVEAGRALAGRFGSHG